MNSTDLLALLPWLIVSATVLLTMLQIAMYRHHGLTVGINVLGYAAALASLGTGAALAPRHVTSLMVIDSYSLFFVGLLLLTALVVSLLSYSYFHARRQQAPELQLGEYYVLLASSTLGGMLLVAATNFLSFFLGLELLSVALFVLVSYTATQRQAGTRGLEAGIKYLILSGISSAILLFGMALLYIVTGSLSLAAMTQLFAAGSTHLNALYSLAGLTLFIVGLGFKLSLVPFHLWTPDVYEGAPAPVTAYLATASKLAVFAFLLRYFQVTGAQLQPALALGITLVAIASMLGGNLLALLQNNVKRMLAYSSIAHLGYLLVAFLASGQFATEAVAFYLTAYTVMTLGAFGVVGQLSASHAGAAMGREVEALDDYRSLLRERPFLGWIFTAMLLSLAGIPLTVGFIAKFYLLAAGVQSSLWLLVIVLIAGSTIGLFYYLRVIIIMSMPRPAQVRSGQGDDPALISTGRSAAMTRQHSPGTAAMLLGGAVLAILALLLVWLGVYPSPFLQLLHGISTAIGA